MRKVNACSISRNLVDETKRRRPLANRLLLDALQGKNQTRPPVWLMRQAGRYLPEYRALRKNYPLKDLFLTPELAVAATLMPVEQLKVDAAILFSDITLIALALGLKLDFQEGPKVEPLLRSADVAALPLDLEPLEAVIKAIQLLMPELKVPLIGFCGGPFTVSSYLVEGGVDSVKKWAYRHPEILDLLLEKITRGSIAFLKRQVEAGVDALHIFDSWANVLSKEHFRRFCLPHYQKIIESVDVPVILFFRNAGWYLDEISSLPCALSIDWQASMPAVRCQTRQTLQGNLDPYLLYAPLPAIREAGRALIDSMRGDRAFIAGLGHGIRPDVSVESVKTLVEALR